MPGVGRLPIWFAAVRPATLTASVVPVIVGTAAAARIGLARPGAATAALGAAVLIQIGTNLANDAEDFRRGADSAARQGPTRVTQAGLLSPSQVWAAAWLAFAAATALGLYLCAVAGWPVAALGIAAIGSGLAYTGGPWPLGYHGLGDVFVFVFFGLAGVAGTYYVQTGSVSSLALAASIPVGALATAILVVNNVRDLETDRAVRKRTLAVHLGDTLGRAQFVALITLAYMVPVALWLTDAACTRVMLPWLTAPWALSLSRTVATCTDGPSFNAALRGTARLHGVFGVLLAIGLLA